MLALGKDSTKGIEHARNKTLDADYCGSCYSGAPPASNCCNTCEEVRDAYQRNGWSFRDPESIEQCQREGWGKRIEEESHEGCNVHGFFEINKVQGNFHFAPGRSFQQQGAHVHDLHEFNNPLYSFDFSHTIHDLSFGKKIENFHNPLDGVVKNANSRILILLLCYSLMIYSI